MAPLQDHFSLKAACSNIITALSSYHLNNNIMIICVKECGLGNFIWWAFLSVTRSFFNRLNPSRQKTDIVRSKNAKNCASYVHCLQVAITTVVSKTKHSKTKTEARSTQNSKTKHPRSKTKTPKSRKRSTLDRKRSTQISKTKTPKLENEAPESGGCSGWMRPHLQRSTKSIPRFYKSLPTV